MTDIQTLQEQVPKKWNQADNTDKAKIIQDIRANVGTEHFRDELAAHMYIEPRLVLDARLNDFKDERSTGKASDAKRAIQDLFNPDFLDLMHNDIPVDWVHLRTIDAATLSKVLDNLHDSKGLAHLKDIISQAWDAQDYSNALSCSYARYGQAFTRALGQHHYHGTDIVVSRLQDAGKSNLSHEIAKDAIPLWQTDPQGVRPLGKQDLFDILETIDRASTADENQNQ